MPLSDLPHSPLPSLGPWPQTFLDDIHLALLNRIPTAVYRNALINGSLAVSQRAAPGPNYTADVWIADRWRFELGAGNTCQVSLTPIPTFPFRLPELCPNYIQFNRTVTGANPTKIWQRIENVRSLNGQVSTTGALSQASFSFYALKNVSPIYYEVWLTQNFGTGGAPSSPVTTIVASGTIPASSTIARYTQTFDVPSIASKAYGTNGDSFVELALVFPASSGNIGPANMFVGALQLERNATPGPFEVESLDVTLARCQRYYSKTYPPSSNPGATNAPGVVSTRAGAVNAIIGGIDWRFPVRMRSTPTVTAYSPVTGTAARIRNGTTGADLTVNGFTDTSDAATGYMTLSAAPAAATDLLLAHYTAEAEL